MNSYGKNTTRQFFRNYKSAVKAGFSTYLKTGLLKIVKLVPLMKPIKRNSHTKEFGLTSNSVFWFF